MVNNLGKILHKRRKSKRLTLKRLHVLSGVSVSHMGRVERGERFPSGHILRRLAEPLDFSEPELLKLAGFLSQDEGGDRLQRFKDEIKREMADALVNLCRKIDGF